MDGRRGHQIRQWTVTDCDCSQYGQRSKSEAPDGEVPSLEARTSTFRPTSANVRRRLLAPEKPRRQQVSHQVVVARGQAS